MDIATILATKGTQAVSVRPEESIRSERDIVREASRNEQCFGRTVADLMTRDVITGQPHDDLATVANTGRKS
jgi:hypothetical protein